MYCKQIEVSVYPIVIHNNEWKYLLFIAELCSVGESLRFLHCCQLDHTEWNYYSSQDSMDWRQRQTLRHTIWWFLFAEKRNVVLMLEIILRAHVWNTVAQVTGNRIEETFGISSVYLFLRSYGQTRVPIVTQFQYKDVYS